MDVRLYLGILTLLMATWAAAEEAAPPRFEDHQAIQQAVEAFVQREKGDDAALTTTRLDRRLKLRRCEQPLSVFWPPGSRKLGSVSVGVRCDGAKPWKIYVQANIREYREVAVARRALARGDRLTAGDITLERRDVSRLAGRYVTDASRLLGREASQTIREGALILPGMFRAPRVVKRGQTVTLLAGSRGFEVRMPGKALADGVEGARIRVRNSRSKRIVEGRVLAGGVIRVDQ